MQDILGYVGENYQALGTLFGWVSHGFYFLVEKKYSLTSKKVCIQYISTYVGLTVVYLFGAPLCTVPRGLTLISQRRLVSVGMEDHSSHSGGC